MQNYLEVLQWDTLNTQEKQNEEVSKKTNKLRKEKEIWFGYKWVNVSITRHGTFIRWVRRVLNGSACLKTDGVRVDDFLTQFVSRLSWHDAFLRIFFLPLNTNPTLHDALPPILKVKLYLGPINVANKLGGIWS